MTDKRKLANQALSAFLKNFGFKKKGSVWVLRKKEFLLTIDLQKSQWSDIYYVNTGIQFENLDERLPKTYKGQITFRVVKAEGLQKDTYNLDTEVQLIQSLIEEQVLKDFTNLETKDEVKKLITNNRTRYLVTLKGKELLGIQ